MERLILETEFKQIGKQEQLRCDSKYRYFYDVKKEVIVERLKTKFSEHRLKSILKLNKTKIFKKGLLDDEYILIELDDIDPGSGEIKRERKVEEIGSDKTLFADSDILISKLMPQAGHIILNDRAKKYIGTTELIGFKIINSQINKKYLLYLLLSIRKNFELLTSGKTHPRIQIQDILRIKIPKTSKDIQEETVKKIEKTEEQIKKEKQKLVPLQDVIEEVFIKYGVKSTEFEKKEFEAFTTDAFSIGKQKFLRCGPQYRAFLDFHKGLLFEDGAKFPIIKLGSVMKLHKTKTLKKGILDKEYILLDLEDLEQYTGRVRNVDKLVSEIGSDKTLFKDADIIVSKIDPYLGYTFLNDQSKPLIGSTELLPYKVNKKLALPEYIKYLLLSHEYIFNSGLMMYGKRHPRIHPLDIVDIKIPLPDLDIQRKIISEIHKQETINEEAKQKIKGFRESINKIIFENLMEET